MLVSKPLEYVRFVRAPVSFSTYCSRYTVSPGFIVNTDCSIPLCQSVMLCHCPTVLLGTPVTVYGAFAGALNETEVAPLGTVPGVRVSHAPFGYSRFTGPHAPV